nr:VCBS repeat-containing protein [Gemmata palustris]
MFTPQFGDFDGDGRVDLVSGSNCCDPWTVHLFLRKADGTFAARQEITFIRSDMTPKERDWVMRGHSQPHLLDWDRDGRTDLVLADPQSWKLLVGVGPLKGRSEVTVKPFDLPEVADRKPYDFQFADWDGDGVFDVLFAGGYLSADKTRWLCDLYWCRNASREGQPRFEKPVRLLTAPAQSDGWEYEGFAVADRGRAGHQDLVVSVSKDWKRKPEKGWTNKSQLVHFRRK